MILQTQHALALCIRLHESFRDSFCLSSKGNRFCSRKRFVVCIQNEASDYLLPSARLLTYFSRQYVHACADLFPQVVNKSLMCM